MDWLLYQNVVQVSPTSVSFTKTSVHQDTYVCLTAVEPEVAYADLNQTRHLKNPYVTIKIFFLYNILVVKEKRNVRINENCIYYPLLIS